MFHATSMPIPICSSFIKASKSLSEIARLPSWDFLLVAQSRADLSRRLGEQCRKLALISPGGFGEAHGRQLDLRPAPAANPTDPHYRAVIRHNLLAMMLHDPNSIDDRTIDLQCDNIAHTRFNSLKVSLQPTLLSNLASMTCPLLMISGQRRPRGLSEPGCACRRMSQDQTKHGLGNDSGGRTLGSVRSIRSRQSAAVGFLVRLKSRASE